MSARVRPGARPLADPAARRAMLADRDSWTLLPLRLFLGSTFVFAGLQKLADRWFLKASAPSSLQSQLHAAARTSPVGGLAGGLAHGAIIVGLLIAFGELGVGIGALAGLWTRYAALGGLLLSIGFLLTVSWHTRPYYYGADIVFVFAWTPLIIGGGGRWSLDAWTTSEARRDLNLPEPRPVRVGFETVQRLCGAYDKGRCRAQQGRRCRPAGCPVLVESETQGGGPDLDRRAFLQQAGLAGWLASAAVVTGAAVALLGRLIPPRASATPSTPALGAGSAGLPADPSATVPAATAAPTAPSAGPTTGPVAQAGPGTTAVPTTPPPVATTAPPVPTTPRPVPTTAASVPAGTRIGPSAAVPVGGAARFNDPTSGDPAYVVQPSAGTFVAFDALCTHQGCTVEYAGAIFQCPCHGAEFDTRTGAVLRGPATRALVAIHVKKGGDGNLYVT